MYSPIFLSCVSQEQSQLTVEDDQAITIEWFDPEWMPILFLPAKVNRMPVSIYSVCFHIIMWQITGTSKWTINTDDQSSRVKWSAIYTWTGPVFFRQSTAQ